MLLVGTNFEKMIRPSTQMFPKHEALTLMAIDLGEPRLPCSDSQSNHLPLFKVPL